MKQNRRSLLVTAASLITTSSFPVIAQSTFPSRPIRLVVPFLQADPQMLPLGQSLNALLTIWANQ